MLQDRLRKFTAERDWGQFHSPKNLCMALAAEVGELIEHFQWVTQEASNSLPLETQRRVQEEIADVFIYLVRLADELDVDLVRAVARKITINETKYPAAKARGSSKKYSDYG